MITTKKKKKKERKKPNKDDAMTESRRYKIKGKREQRIRLGG